MRFLADLHLHSEYSRATSSHMTFDTLAAWAKIKGISLLGTSDFTHPEWRGRIRKELEPEGNGFFRRKRFGVPDDERVREFAAKPGEVHFVLSTELSFIYAKKEKTRRVHLLVLTGKWQSAQMLCRRLARKGNLAADGRPIFGMDAADLVRMAADVDPDCLVIPAHIWTPWFSLFGANSGFDSIDECFEEMAPFIPALETGLSSDPRMTRRISALDRFALISNSDAHSPANIGREANAFNTEFSYRGLREAIRLRDPSKFAYTIEFFPEEGKYYADGHRKCGVVLSPADVIRKGQLCPKCGGKLTPGVCSRIDRLADRSEKAAGKIGIPFRHMIPLREIIGEALGAGINTKTVQDAYFSLIREYGDEHFILAELSENDLRRTKPERVGEGIIRARRGRVGIEPGYDGVYGRVRIFN